MSNVVKGRRGPSHFRAAMHLTFGCVLLGGCSAGSGRFDSSSFGSGYDAGASAKTAAAPSQKVAADTSQTAQQASYRPQPQSGYLLASASQGQQSGYLQVSRVDLPPLPQATPAQGTKTADGYGPYNQPPISDGSYTGPRVYTPYEEPRGDAPPPAAYAPDQGDPRGFDRGTQPAPRDFYRPSDGGAGDARAYQPQPGNYYRDGESYQDGQGPGYDRLPERGAYASPRSRSNHPEGERIRVEPGDTLYSLARRYGVTVDMIARANGLTTVYVRPGTIIYIPRADPAAYGPAQTPAPSAQAGACSGAHCHVVKPGETVAGIARIYNLTEKQIAEANNLTSSALKAGQTIVIPPAREAPRRAIASAQDRAAPPAGQSLLTPAPGADQPVNPAVKPGPAPTPVPLQQAPEFKAAELTPLPEASCEAALANPQPRMGNTFRKPVEGKTIAQFGPQRDGTVNEGVTISVPKGTPIKAAENGVVAYAGNELPGYGNLILIRHADEYVTAYAHADSILVKKCDVVKRGQTVATAGTSGDASQPQVHFEIRKNSKPVDPSPLLGS
ncbi:MAG: peptidoglycan DD-metalloendopeptidase family protein [Rhodomicrobium sp.]